MAFVREVEAAAGRVCDGGRIHGEVRAGKV
jgi:hypothetical protein